MKTITLSTSGFNPAIAVLGLLAALLVVAVLSGRKLPLLSSDRAALFALIVIGMAICSQGGLGRISATGAWAHPLAILGYLCGAAILLIGLFALFGKPLPPLANFHQAFLAVTVIAVFKVILSTIHRFWWS
jgi:hypothetical protein